MLWQQRSTKQARASPEIRRSPPASLSGALSSVCPYVRMKRNHPPAQHDRQKMKAGGWVGGHGSCGMACDAGQSAGGPAGWVCGPRFLFRPLVRQLRPSDSTRLDSPPYGRAHVTTLPLPRRNTTIHLIRTGLCSLSLCVFFFSIYIHFL